jgi:hypothetical protein
VTAATCSQCGAPSLQAARFCQDCGFRLVATEEQVKSPGKSGEPLDTGDDGRMLHLPDERLRIVLGDSCPICRAVSRLTFTFDHPPIIPVTGCREESGCRCSLPPPPAVGALTDGHSPASADLGDSATNDSEPQDLEQAPQEAATADGSPLIGVSPEASDDGQSGRRDLPINCQPWPAFIDIAALLSSQAARRGSTQSLLLISLNAAPEVPEDPHVAPEGAGLELPRLVARVIRSGDLLGLKSERCVAVLASDTAMDGAVELGRRIEQEWIRNTGYINSVSQGPLAIGIASMPEAGPTFEGLFDRTEDSLKSVLANSELNLSLAATEERRATNHCAEAFGQERSIGEMERRRRECLAAATLAYQRGEILGVAIFAQPNACLACRVAAKHVYALDNVPVLPSIGCTGPDDCQCSYAISELVAPAGPEPPPPVRYETLNIPHSLYDAAVFSVHPTAQCRADLLAEYLDVYSLLPVVSDIEMLPNEVLYCRREAQRGWERSIPDWATVKGAPLPLQGSLADGIKLNAPPPSLPDDSVPYRQDGMMYITNWQISFDADGERHSLNLREICGVDWFPNSIACHVTNRRQRTFFFLPNALQVGLVLTRAVRDARGERDVCASNTCPAS